MTYRIAHAADLHLGYKDKVPANEKGTNIRAQDGYDAFRELVAQIINFPEKIDAFVLAGDLFHVSKPTIKDITVAQHYFRELSKHGIPCYILSGNHDATDIRSEIAANAVIDDPQRNIFSLINPYKKYELADGILLHSIAHHGLSAEDTPKFEVSSNDINIFTTHGAALDPKNNTLMRCMDSPREQIVPMDLITDELFSAVLLGHYHSRYEIGGSGILNTAYAGSTLRRGFSDDAGERGWWLISVEGDGTVTFDPQNIHQRPQFDLKAIDASNLDAQQVLDQLEINLAGTRPEGDSESILNGVDRMSPIVRQRVTNAPRSVRETLDRKRINTLSKHTLKWQLEFMNNASTRKEENEEKDNKKLSFSKKINILEQFSDWVTESKKTISEEYVDIVIEDAEKILKESLETGKDIKHAHN